MAKPAQPTHLKLFFIRSVRVQKAHISGSKTEEGGELMQIVKKGESATISYVPALDLVIANSALEVKASEAEVIAEYKRQFEEESAREKNAASAAEKKTKAA